VLHQDVTIEDYERHLRSKINPPSEGCCCQSAEGLWGQVNRPSRAGLVFLAHHAERNDWAVYGEATACPTGGVRVEAVVRPRTHVYIFMAIWMIISVAFCARFRSPLTIAMAVIVLITLAIIVKISQQGVRMYILQPLGIMAGPGSGQHLPLLVQDAKAYTPLVVPGQALG